MQILKNKKKIFFPYKSEHKSSLLLYYLDTIVSFYVSFDPLKNVLNKD